MPNLEATVKRKQLVVANAVYRNDIIDGGNTPTVIPRGTVLAREKTTKALRPYDGAVTPVQIPVGILTEDYVTEKVANPIRVLVGGLVNLKALLGKNKKVPTLSDILKLKGKNIYAISEIQDAEIDN